LVLILDYNNNTHLMALCLGLPGWTNCILLHL